MEKFIILWINQHIDIIKYAAIVLGFIYSAYRQFVSDRREDKSHEQQDNCIDRLNTYLNQIDCKRTQPTGWVLL